MAIPPYLELMLSIEQEEELTMYIPGTKTFIENADVRAIYLHVNGHLRNFERFKEKIRSLATVYNGKLVYKDENELFKAFKENFPEYFQTRNLNNLSELISLVPVEDDEDLAFRAAKRRFPGMDRNNPNYYDD